MPAGRGDRRVLGIAAVVAAAMRHLEMPHACRAGGTGAFWAVRQLQLPQRRGQGGRSCGNRSRLMRRGLKAGRGRNQVRTSPEMNRPSLIFVAGPNGAGKTTVAPRILRDELDVRGLHQR